MPYFYPLASFLLPILAVYSVARIYRSVYPYESVKAALEAIAEYRLLSRSPSKRAAKRARQLAPRARAARRMLLRALLFKMVALTGVFMATTLLIWAAPLAYSPFELPLFTGRALIGEGGETPVAYTPVLHLAGYIYALLLFRDYLL